MSNERRRPTAWRNLFLVRHGESTANEINRFAGAIDAPLTPLGRAQAERAGINWDSGDIDRVYVSPLLRARQTADILLDCAGWQTAAPSRVLLDDRLTERHFGDFTLKNKTSLQRQFGLRDYEAALYHSDSELHGGEPFEVFRGRILDFVKHELYPLLCRGERILIVAHKYVIELLSRLILRLTETEGHDLRLPNARIIAGSNLENYVRRESPMRNWLCDFFVVHHAAILSVAALVGLLMNAADTLAKPPQWLLLCLLCIATTISLARISLTNPSGSGKTALTSPLRLILRFVALPWAVTLAIATAWPTLSLAEPNSLMGMALLLAAPAAVTAVVLSRASGGMILPSALVVLMSTAICLGNTIALLAYFGQADQVLQTFLTVAVSSGSLLLPVLAVHSARQRCPIKVAKAAEDHAALAVLALALFVVLSFQQIALDSFYPSGLVACLLGVLLRLVALKLSRNGSLYGVDDYFSMSYPNIFLVIILANLLGNETLLNLATWFLVPMFAMSPIDDLLIRHLQHSQSHISLLSYLQINSGQLHLPGAALCISAQLEHGRLPAHRRTPARAAAGGHRLLRGPPQLGARRANASPSRSRSPA